MKNGWSYYRDTDGTEVKHAPKTLVGNVYVQEEETEGLQSLLDAKLENKAGVIQTTHIADGAVTGAKIALLAFDTVNIKDLAVTVAKIADAAVKTAKIADAAITRAKIGAAAIGTAEIENAAITTAKIALGAITTALIKAGAIGTVQIADGSITDAKIVELTANKINAGTLSVERLIIVGSTQSIVYTINQANGTAQLSQTTIDGGALTQRSITADRIAAGAITANEIAAATILANNIAAGQIQAGHIASDAIEARHIKAGEITTNKISAATRSELIQDTYQRVAGIDIALNGVSVIGKQFDVRDVEGSEPAFVVDAVSKIIKALSAQFNFLTLNGPLTGTGHNVLTKGSEPLFVLTPGNAQSVIDSAAKFRKVFTTFRFMPGVYDIVNFLGFSGVDGITLDFQEGAVLSGLYIQCNSVVFMINTPSATDIAKYLNIKPKGAFRGLTIWASNVNITGGIRITGRNRANAADGTDIGILVTSNSTICTDGAAIIVEKIRDHAVYIGSGSHAYLSNVYGGQLGGDYNTLANLGNGVVSYAASDVVIEGKSVIGNAANTVNRGSPPVTGTGTPTASPGAYTPPATQTVQYVYNSAKYCDLPSSANMGTASSVWSPSSPRGGLWNAQNQRYAGMWLLQRVGGSVEDIRTLLIGKTVISATLRVHCVDCWSGSAVHDLYYMTIGTLPVGGDAPNSRLVDTGVDITIVQGQDTVVDATAFVQGRVSAGDDFYGFGLGLSGQYVRMDTTCVLDIVYQ